MSNKTKEERINKEIKRLKKIFSDLPENVQSLCEGLINRAAYMRVTLEDYEADMDANGYVEQFTQSKDTEPYERGRPVVSFYNTMAKNYQTIIKQLVERLPEDSAQEAVEEINAFISGGKK